MIRYDILSYLTFYVSNSTAITLDILTPIVNEDTLTHSFSLGFILVPLAQIITETPEEEKVY